MRNPFKVLFAKGTLMSRLLRTYAAFMVFLTTVAALLIGWNTYSQNQQEAERTLQDAIQSTNRMLNDKRSSSRLILNQLSGSYDKIENITAYLTKPVDEYFAYIYPRQKDIQDFFLFPEELRSIYVNYDDLKSLYISLGSFPEYLESTVENKQGDIKKGTPKIREEAFYIMMPIVQGGVNGSMFIGFKESDFEESLKSLNSFGGLSVYVLSGTTNQLYQYHDEELANWKSEWQESMLDSKLQKNSQLPVQELAADYLTDYQDVGGDYRIFVTLEKAAVQRNWFRAMLPFFLGMILLDAALLFVLIRTFKRYSKQVETVSEAMDSASSGNLEARIDTSQTEYELRELSEGINHMLDSIERYVNDIYKLEIQQQEAHMRALQAQINPHFLYNTLEYIRMYALSEGSEELADVVYAFSTLLRNNINAEKTTTLKEELDFCEKYVYLYQMRYPNRIAYHFTIEEDLNHLIIPKFTIQPLIENYFKHGIDFTRKNNGISVKAYQMDRKVFIEVRDNGKGITKERIAELEERLANSKNQLHDSIGLQNVNERMRGFYGKKYHMKLWQNDVGGLTIQISMEKEDKIVSSTVSG